MPTYRKNFITGVIFRIDFDEAYDSFNDSIPDELERAIMGILPTKEIHQTKNEELLIDSLKNKVTRRSVEVREHNYYGNEKKKRIAFTRDYFFVEFSQFISYDDFYAAVVPVIDYMRRQQSVRSKRIGLRYINQFNLLESEPLNWSAYLNEKMIKNINFLEEDDYALSRVLTMQEYIKGSNRILIQYGLTNPDFPGPIVKKHYVLDIDVSRTGVCTSSDFNDAIEEMHQIQEYIFEKSITDGMRGYLNA